MALCMMPWISYAQTQTKSKQKEIAPSQQEMQDIMKEAQKALDNMSPEDKKMMEGMGIKMPSFKETPSVSDTQLSGAYDDETQIVPKKDAARIASISKIPLNNSTLPPFISSAHSKVISQLKPDSKSKGEEIYQLIKSSSSSSAVIVGNTAANLWVFGKVELALYVMGKACVDDPTNSDNLNNYAAMLSMSGAEQLSIPLLNTIYTRFPGNSTILNNLGQAWFGLGDIEKAEDYIDSTIRIYAYHPQSNITKAAIEESKGNTAAAVEATIKSIKHAYSKEKEDHLRKLGHELEGKDVRWPFNPKPNTLGLESFQHPDYPKSVDESIALEKEWDKFRNECEARIAGLQAQAEQASKVMISAHQKRTQEALALVKSAVNGGGNKGNLGVVPFYEPKAILRLRDLIGDEKSGYKYQLNKATEEIAGEIQKTVKLRFDYDKAIITLDSIEFEQTGEGLANRDFCPQLKAVTDAYLAAVNTNSQKLWENYLEIYRKKMEDEIYWLQYIQWPEEFAVTQLKYQMNWLGAISSGNFESITKYKCESRPAKVKGGKLSEYDVVHCVYHSHYKSPVGTIDMDCSRLTSTLDLKFVKLGLKQDMNKETFNDQFMSGSVEVGAGMSVGSRNAGPLKVEASVGASIAMEFDRTGVTDVILKGAAGVSAGTDIVKPASDALGVSVNTELKDGEAGDVGAINDLQVEVGVNGQISLISGKSSAEGTGMLKGLSIK
jgi:tetratricopeptide (TPR) repeat protein